MKVFWDDRTLAHDTHELLASKIIRALECPERITDIVKRLKESTNHQVIPIEGKCNPDLFSLELYPCILSKHDTLYVEHLKTCHKTWVDEGIIDASESVLPECFRIQPAAGQKAGPPRDIFGKPGYFAFDMSSGIAEGTWSSALASAHLAMAGADHLSSGSSIMVLTRPPGHHCDGERAGGYCYINNVSVAVERLLRLAPDLQITILDLDLHHGNGTQSMYYAQANPCYISIHGAGEFPYYTGGTDEQGVGEGEGFNLNLPLPAGTELPEYLTAMKIALQKVEAVKTDILVVSMGFDTYYLDPLKVFLLRTLDYRFLGRKLRKLKLPTLIVLEGGYQVEDLGKNVVSFLDGFEDSDN